MSVTNLLMQLDMWTGDLEQDLIAALLELKQARKELEFFVEKSESPQRKILIVDADRPE